jgi:apolipoprotein N-acyltransferase
VPADPGGAARPARRPLQKPVPGELFVWVKRLSWVELAIFAGLILFWLVPGFDTETMLFGWAHGLGFIALCVLIWIACVRREAPYTLLAATLTPVGPVGSVIAIELIERKGWGIAPQEPAS